METNKVKILYTSKSQGDSLLMDIIITTHIIIEWTIVWVNEGRNSFNQYKAPIPRLCVEQVQGRGLLVWYCLGYNLLVVVDQPGCLTRQWNGGQLAPPLLCCKVAGRVMSDRSHSGRGQELGESGSHSGGTPAHHPHTHAAPSPTMTCACISIQHKNRWSFNSLLQNIHSLIYRFMSLSIMCILRWISNFQGLVTKVGSLWVHSLTPL